MSCRAKSRHLSEKNRGFVYSRLRRESIADDTDEDSGERPRPRVLTPVRLGPIAPPRSPTFRARESEKNVSTRAPKPTREARVLPNLPKKRKRREDFTSRRSSLTYLYSSASSRRRRRYLLQRRSSCRV